MTCGDRIPHASRRIDEILFAPDSVHNRYCPQHQRHTQPRTSLLFLSIFPSSVLTYRLGFFPSYTARHAHRILANARLRPAPQSFSYGTVSHQLPPARPLHPVSFFPQHRTNRPGCVRRAILCTRGVAHLARRRGFASCGGRRRSFLVPRYGTTVHRGCGWSPKGRVLCSFDMNDVVIAGILLGARRW